MVIVGCLLVLFFLIVASIFPPLGCFFGDFFSTLIMLGVLLCCTVTEKLHKAERRTWSVSWGMKLEPIPYQGSFKLRFVRRSNALQWQLARNVAQWLPLLCRSIISIVVAYSLPGCTRIYMRNWSSKLSVSHYFFYRTLCCQTLSGGGGTGAQNTY